MNKCITADKCHENSVATSSSAAKWWPDVDATSLTSWTGGATYSSNNPPCNNPQKPNSNCSGGEEDVSISTSFTTNASNNSGHSMESSRRLIESASTNKVYGEAVSDNHHLWSQVLLGVGTTGELQNISTRMFEPACDYLKKTTSGWDFSSTTNINHLQKNFNELNNNLYQNNIPSSVSSWSIAPPDVEITQQINHYSGQFTAIKNEHTESDTEREGLCSHAIEYQVGINDMVVGDNTKYYYDNGLSTNLECGNGRGFVDLVAFGSGLSKPPLDSTMNLPDQRKHTFHSSHQLQSLRPKGSTISKINGKANGVANEGKRKKSEDQSATILKKPKHEPTTVSLTKVQIPKAKLGDKITALQQIVSPFGKTDTASVLWEAIGYIKCLQEQVQLLSNPYMKTNVIKDQWGGLQRKDIEDVKFDLKSRGLCLVPTSYTPQVYHENNGSDYWIPTYRGCFYR